MKDTVLRARAFAGDLTDALHLLTSGPLDPVSGGPPRSLWASVSMTRAAADAVAPDVAALLKAQVLVSAVDGRAVTITLYAGDRRRTGPVDGRDASMAGELSAALGVSDAGALIAALTDTSRSAWSRRDAADEALGLPRSIAPMSDDRGLLIVSNPLRSISSRLPVEGHGAWIVPAGPQTCIVVSDGSGWATGPDRFVSAVRGGGTVEAALTDMIGLRWGARPAVWVADGEGRTEVAFTGSDVTPGSGVTRRIASTLGRPDLVGAVATALAPPKVPEARMAALLDVVGIGQPPVGADADDLAAWAAEQDGSVHVAAPVGTSLTMLRQNPAEVARTYRRRRAVRRAQTTTGAIGIAAAAAASVAWTENAFTAVAVSAGAAVVLGLVYAMLRRVTR